ncbi:MAG: hypothetical protein M3347_02535, partial [Armatimonadota bacterium]|nr:hypothetical protein [Armatimonadota bacterium]
MSEINKAKDVQAKNATPAMPLDYTEICRLLPHRPPFLFVDSILEWEPRRRCVGVKNVTANESLLQGHYPGYPVLPGGLLMEAIGQVA